MRKVNPRHFEFPAFAKVNGVLQNVGHTVSQVRIAADANVDHYYSGWAAITLTSGPARGDSRIITSFLTANDDILVDRPFRAIPGADTYVITMFLRSALVIGKAVGGAADSIDLATTEGIRDSFWEECRIELIGGLRGSDSSPKSNGRRIQNYDGAARRAYVDRPWEGGAPDATTLYRIYPHLYTPMSEFEIWELAGAPLELGYSMGQIAFGMGLDVTKWGSGDDEHDLTTGLGVSGAGTICINRWE